MTLAARSAVVLLIFGIGVGIAGLTADDEAPAISSSPSQSQSPERAASPMPIESQEGRAAQAPFSTVGSPSTGAPSKPRPVYRLGSEPEDERWQDNTRNDKWARGMEATLGDVTQGRLRQELPGARWKEARCMSQTCQIVVEASADHEAALRLVLAVLVTVDDVRAKVTDLEPGEDGQIRLEMQLLFPEAERSPDWFRREQADADNKYPGILESNRAARAELR